MYEIVRLMDGDIPIPKCGISSTLVACMVGDHSLRYDVKEITRIFKEYRARMKVNIEGI